MPDLAGLMNNPMFAGMARNLMQNPEALSGLMNNPRIAEMMQGMQGGGGIPDASQLRGMMNDPRGVVVFAIIIGQYILFLHLTAYLSLVIKRGALPLAAAAPPVRRWLPCWPGQA